LGDYLDVKSVDNNKEKGADYFFNKNKDFNEMIELVSKNQIIT